MSEGAGGKEAPVRVLLAGPLDRATAWYNALAGDARFQVYAITSEAEDLERKLRGQPEVLLLDGSLYPGPAQLIDTVSSSQAATYILMPVDATEEIVAQVRGLPAVKGVFRGELNLPQLMDRIHQTALALRARAPLQGVMWKPGGSAAVAGLRVVTVWNAAGGVGKTTVATALAHEAARRGFATLLVGLGAPDDLPMLLGLDPEPNLARWAADPTPEGLRALVQPLGDLDVIVGFRNGVEESLAAGVPPEDPGSIPSLAMTAAYQGYAVIVLDASSPVTAPLAIMAANTLLLVARPTAADVHRTMEAVRMVEHHMAGRHRLSPGRILVVLNRRTSSDCTEEEWHSLLDGGCRKAGLATPPMATVIAEDPMVRTAQNDAKLPSQASDEAARGAHALAEMLFGGASSTERRDGRVVKIGRLRLRFRR